MLTMLASLHQLLHQRHWLACPPVLSSSFQVCAAGALLAVLSREGRLGGGGGTEGGVMMVNSISEVKGGARAG